MGSRYIVSISTSFLNRFALLFCTMARIGGFRRKTRYKLTKGIREKGKVTVTRHLQEFKVGERVRLKLEPSVHKGTFNPRFQGKNGVVKAKKGNCYEVLIKDMNKEKNVVVHPVHLVRE